ncbi:ExeA5 [Desulforapulum autotrophicum HRM2]|uniref:ExeA1 n=1 Tax=Desulforapulum autotrophicum (strain ATCC 43914 / DSM 3382 / VKM B-1955 / HRM2) TaxID=177437 RepID=C0QC17_DESAH|nr:ATP-binding protein [Desulforapulum autotrophicum]ACN15029.1 ExeA1 [Desulforapulum autotrophicum HRM2]ACN17523.1 ExeA5 [Desulforapulum autotrophicum HRM2]
MNNIDIQSLYGLKYNPFLPNIPKEALYALPGSEIFELRIRSMAEQGGFALITGEPGLGKSKTLHKMACSLERIPDLTVGVMQRPQSKLGDFYRELGELFNVALSPANRYGGFKMLRERWIHHCQTTLFKPVLLIDEAQHVSDECLTELRILQSHQFDSKNLLFTVLCGDNRLPERFRSPELLPLGSRIGPRLVLEPLSPEQLQNYLRFALDQAGNSQLMSDELIRTLASHAANNLRVLNQMAAELLNAAAIKELPVIDESLFFQIFSPSRSRPRQNQKDPF